MVISVDTGNKMIKTEHYEFNSGIDVLDTIPGENDEVIEFGGKYYRTTNRRISYMEDKTEDDRYYILTLIAIAKELDTMKKEAVLAPNELIEIELLVGLPPAHYGKYRKKFQQYFQRDGKVVGFKYGGTSYQILIHEVKVYVQAYAAYCVLAARRHLTEKAERSSACRETRTAGAEATAERRQGDVQEAGERKSPDAEGTAEKRCTETERAGQGEFQADP